MTPALRQVIIADYNPSSYVGGTKRAVYAKSKAYKKVFDELFDYTTGKLKGGSVLVSGHRGAGKTTLINNVVFDLTAILGERKFPCKPFFVPLHGPDLLDPDRTEKPAQENTDGSPADGQPAKRPHDEALAAKKKSVETAISKKQQEEEKKSAANKLIKNVLEHLTISLYRSLADEFFETFQKKVRESGRAHELKELIGLLRLELDDSSDISTLRSIWDEAGFLDKGLLFPDRQHDQGVQEIVLLASAAQAFRIVTGSITDTEDLNSDTKNERTVSSEYKLISRDIINGILSLASGAAVGLGVANMIDDKVNVLAGGLAGIITALVSGYTFTSTTKRTSNKGSSRQYKFIRNTDISSLNRDLPNLIKRMKSIGLAPVFVIDELDKVMPPYGDFGSLIRYLKNLVNDHSFFCFLTDRSYYDYMSNLDRENRYPIEYTYFTNSVYVNYSPQDFHTYLNELFQLHNIQDREIKADAILLQYLLLNRASLHTIDLKRELTRRAEEGIISLENIRSKHYFRFPITLQLAIESIIEETEIIERFDLEPYFSQLVVDTLYYPMRKWAEGETELDVRPEIFEAYMKSRSEFYSKSDKTNGLNGAPKNDKKEPVKFKDLDFLLKKLDHLIDLLMDSEKLTKKILSGQLMMMADPIERQDILQIIANTIPKNKQNALHNYGLLIQKEKDIYQWCYDYHGRDLMKEREMEDVDKKINFLLALDKTVNDLTSGQMDLTVLANIRIIHSSPWWQDVVINFPKLQAYVDDDRNTYPELESDLQTLGEFFNMITSRGKAIARSFALAEVVASQLENYYWTDIFEGFRIFDWYSDDHERKVDSLLTQMGRSQLDWDVYDQIPGLFPAWLNDFKKIFSSKGYTKRSKTEIHQKWWEHWRKRLMENINGNYSGFEVTIEDLVCLSERYSWSHDFHFTAGWMNKLLWSDIITKMWNRDLASTDPPPNWLIKAAFLQLSFTDLNFNILEIEDKEWATFAAPRLPNAAPSAFEFGVLVYQRSQYYSYNFEIGKPLFIIDYDKWKNDKSLFLGLIRFIRDKYKLTTLVTYFNAATMDDEILECVKILEVDEKNVFVFAPYGNVESKFTVVRNLNNIGISS